MIKSGNYFFFLGGYDLEMLTIRELLQKYSPDSYCDKKLLWGAKASDYRDEISDALQAGKIPVFIELIDDLQLGGKVIIVDHHGALAGKDRPTSLHQVFALLGLEEDLWTRHLELVAANDRAYIEGMVEVGATKDEIITYRAKDRAAQGITQEQEREAEVAIANLKELCDGQLTLVSLSHNRTAAVADRLAPELGGAGYKNLLIISPNETNFFGAGNIIKKLDQRFPGGWFGGRLPESGFWGRTGEPPGILSTVVGWLNEQL